MDKFDDVVREIPVVRKDLGYPPLVTPLSQMVVTQAVTNVITNTRYVHLCSEVKSYLKGEYGIAPGDIVVDLLKLTKKDNKTKYETSWEEEKEKVGAAELEDCDALTCVLFPQVGNKFLDNRNRQLEQPMTAEASKSISAPNATESNRKSTKQGIVNDIEPDYDSFVDFSVDSQHSKKSFRITAVMPGTVMHIYKSIGDYIAKGEPLIICESMKMENEIVSPTNGKLLRVHVKVGDTVSMNEDLIEIAV
jgi:biotin carboxyl carrier protein